MKPKAKIGAVAIGAVMASMIALPAFATGFTNELASGNASSTTTGVIKPTQVSVTVPTDAAFDFDPSITAKDFSSQIISPSTYMVRNNTPYVPVYVAITGLAVDKGTVENDIALVNSLGEVKNTADVNSIMFTVKNAMPPAEGSADQWLLTTGIDYAHPFFVDQPTRDATAESGKLAEADGGGLNGGFVEMKFFGQGVAGAGWVSGTSFKITPTFTVRTTDWTTALGSAATP